MSSAGFEPAIPEIERPLIYALDRAATGIALFHIGFTARLVVKWLWLSMVVAD